VYRINRKTTTAIERFTVAVRRLHHVLAHNGPLMDAMPRHFTSQPATTDDRQRSPGSGATRFE
jgi:hypothetical protein